MSESELNYHIKSFHSTSSKKCKNCEKSFKHKMLLKRHMKLHEKKSYPCCLCNKMFALKYYLTKHKEKFHLKVNHNVDQ